MTPEEIQKLLDNLSPEELRGIFANCKTSDEIRLEYQKYQKWTDTDLCEFAEWCSINHWIKYKAEKELWFNDRTFREKTTSQLREIWEVETGRREP